MGRPLILAAIAALLLPVPPAAAQPYRDGLMLPPAQLYQRMLTYAEEKDFEKVGRSLQVARPVTEALKGKYGADVESEIRDGLGRKDVERVTRGLWRLVVLDMRDLMSLALSSDSTEKAATKLRNAYLDYLLLSPGVQGRDFNADQKIRNAFRRAVLNATPTQMREATDEIERELARAFPEPTAKR